LTTSGGIAHNAGVADRPLLSYGLALGSVLVAVLLRELERYFFGNQLPFLTFFLATIVSAWFGGAGPGAVALVLGAVANALLFPSPDQTRLLAFVIVCSVIVFLYGSLHAAKERAEEAHRRELAAREGAEAARERAAFLADANVSLAASLDYDEILGRLADLLVPRVADWCAVDVVDPDGTVRRVAVANADPAKAELSQATTVYPPDPEGRHPRTEVIRTGRPRLIEQVTDEGLASIAAHAEHLRVMRALGYTSAMIVPLRARGRTLGAITCATTAASGHRYGEVDLALVEGVATRAAQALDNARLYREAETARAEAQAASRAKDEFLSVVSHELRTPLASSLGWLRVLRAGRSDVAPRALDTMERSLQAQAKLIEDLLDVSRVVTGRLRVELRPVEIARIVDAAADVVRPQADAKGVRLDVAADPRAGTVAGDPDRLQQVVWNLLTNAIKFTPTGGRVALRLAPAEGRAEIVVVDTGRGIAPEFLPLVFERFRQAAPVADREERGLGIGLAITRHLVELHAGTITVASEGAGRGATFTVTLPLLHAAATRATSEGREALDRARSV
jgi:signal transduction histidine kinase